MTEQKEWDIIVIGGGVVGCAVFRRFCLMGARTLLLEKGGDILSGASKANSALLHTGFDAPTGSLELRCIQAGYREFIDIRERMNLPLLSTGALVVAWNAQQLAALPAIIKQAHDNGVADVAEITAAELYRREPHLAPGALAAVVVPGESVIDPWSTPLAYLTQGVRHGGAYRFNTEITGAERLVAGWHLFSDHGKFHGKIVINCAGIMGDRVESFCRQPDFQIRPRKGQFLVFDKAAAGLVNAIILPVPTAVTKGVLLSKTIFGNLLLGPSAEEQQDREAATVKEEKMRELIAQGKRLLPSLENYSVTASYAGLRPATQYKDYRIRHDPDRDWICVAGIRSTGLTAALGIAQYVAQLYRDHFTPCFTPATPEKLYWPQMPMLSDYALRDYARPNNGGIVCHCELATRREIEAAFDSDVPPECIGGLRRRTRVMMGRCNGFYCSSQVAQMVSDRFGRTLAVGRIDEN